MLTCDVIVMYALTVS